MRKQFLLLQNYPNPFNPRTNVEFAIADADWVKLTVHDLLGRTIAVLVNERRPAGRYQVTWDGRNDAGEVVANGVYIYRLTAGDPSDGSGQVRVATRKMMLVK